MKKLIFTLIFTVTFSSVTFAQKGNTWPKKNYGITGNWSIEKDNGKTYLVLHDDFKTSKGPDSKLFLSKKSAKDVGKNEAVEKNGAFVANLKSNKGSQKYLIPNSISLSDFKSIVVHCEKYTKVWGVTNI